MSQDLTGGTIVVTGAGSGIGEGVARVAGEQGMNVVLADLDGERAELVAETLRADGAQAVAVTTDVRETAACEHQDDGALPDHSRVPLGL